MGGPPILRNSWASRPCYSTHGRAAHATARLAGGPSERAAAEQMHVEVIDGLTRLRPLIDYEAVTGEALLFRDGARRVQEMGMVALGGDGGDSGNLLARHDEDVDGSFGVDIAESDDVRILVDDVGGNLAFDDLREKRHDLILASGGGAGTSLVSFFNEARAAEKV